jgi:Ran GTPase-activating protein (RanGAP) involved in mRNA processing and transport
MIQYDEDTDTLSLNLPGEKLGVAGLEMLMEEVANDDAALNVINISGNINAEEAEQPSKMERVIGLLGKTLKRYSKLKKLNVAGNHLFDNAPHPSNQHITDYLLALTELLMDSTVVDIDLSDNNIIGYSGRQLSSFGIFIRNVSSFTIIGNKICLKLMNIIQCGVDPVCPREMLGLYVQAQSPT